MKQIMTLILGITIGTISAAILTKQKIIATKTDSSKPDCKYCRIQFPADDLETVASLSTQLLEARKENPENPALTIKSGQTNWNMVCTLEDCVLGYD
jgi:hypothetical protein